MAKKSTRGTPLKTSINFLESDLPLFEDAAEMEGAPSVVDWLLMVGRKRARLIAQGSGAVEVTEVIVPLPEGVKKRSKGSQK